MIGVMNLSKTNAVKPYEAFNWQDHAVERQRTYRMTNNADGTITLTPVEGEVYQQGTPINALRLNHIEQGLAEASALAVLTAEHQNQSHRQMILTLRPENWVPEVSEPVEKGPYYLNAPVEGLTADTLKTSIVYTVPDESVKAVNKAKAMPIEQMDGALKFRALKKPDMPMSFSILLITIWEEEA